jgi:glycosyltransferase involved in cell wall biosynthesis
MPAVSVLMPCYNAAATLDEALESLACQTLTDFEIVAVDDGSTDATPQRLQEWARRENRLRLLSQPHAGIIPALNAGLAACQAPYVARMDTDDRAHPERLASQQAYLEAHPETALVSCQVAGFPAGQVRQGFRIYIDWLNSLLSDEDIRREIFVESPLPHPSVTFRRQAVLEAGGYQERGWAEDYDLWLRLYLAGARFAKLPRVLLEWRERPDRLTRTDGRYSLENFLRAKAYYLGRGPLGGREAVFIWGAGMVGRRLSKHLLRQGLPLVAFVDIDPRKIGRTRHGLPILSPEELPEWWMRYASPALLAAVGARGARQLIRHRLASLGLREGLDWWGAA